MDATSRFEDKVLTCLREVARAAREVPADAQPLRLRNALVALVALDVFSAGTCGLPHPPFDEVSYMPGAVPSS